MKHSHSMSSIPFPSVKKIHGRRRTLPHSLSLPTFPSLDFDPFLDASSSSSFKSSSPKRPSPLRQTSLPGIALTSPEASPPESRTETTESLWFWGQVLSKNERLRRKKNKPDLGCSGSVDPLLPSLLDLPVWGTRRAKAASPTAAPRTRGGSLPPPRDVRVKEDWELSIESRIRKYRASV